MDALSKWAWFDLCYMFSDRDFVSDMLETDEKVLAKHVTVNKDGSVTLKKQNILGLINYSEVRLYSVQRQFVFD